MKNIDDDAALEKQSKLFGITHKEREFCIEYFKLGFSQLEKAALLAGYAPTTAKSKCYQIINKPAVKAFLKKMIEDSMEEERMSNAEILARIARLARVDPRKLKNEDGTYKKIHELDEATAYCIRSFKTTTEFPEDGAPPEVVTEVKLADPLPALRTMAQINQLLSPDVGTLNVFIDLDARMDRARERVKEQKKLTKAGAEDARIVSEQ
jgi:hypothetical protein